MWFEENQLFPINVNSVEKGHRQYIDNKIKCLVNRSYIAHLVQYVDIHR